MLALLVLTGIATFCSDAVWAASAEPQAGSQLVLCQSFHSLARRLTPTFRQWPLISILSVRAQKHEYQERPTTMTLVPIRSAPPGSGPRFLPAARSAVLPGQRP